MVKISQKYVNDSMKLMHTLTTGNDIANQQQTCEL